MSEAPLKDRLPAPGACPPDQLLDLFLGYTKSLGLTLYPAQEEALLEIFSGKNVILNTPTGSGKSLVAAAMHFLAMGEGRRSFYTCPIKALVSEKFFALCRDFGPDNVGMLTGDAAINRDAPILCCTAEILSNMALREGPNADVDYVIMDEFHYYTDKDRGTAWQVPLITLPHATFLLMSATLGGTEFFEKELTKVTRRETATVRGTERPVPLDFIYAETPLHETIMDLVKAGKAPVYVVNFTQRSAAETAQDFMSLDFCTKEEKKKIAEAMVGERFDTPFGKEVNKFARHGIGLHHAGLLPKYRRLIERLAQKGLIKIISGTDTLGVGVNIPLRTVLFTKLCKYDGDKTAVLSVRDFQQIAGRAGRKGFDDRGSVVAQAPEHVIENMRLEAKAGSDPGKKRKIVRKKPPEKGYVHWDRAAFDKLVVSPPEPLVSRFQVTHGMLLNVLERETGGCMAIARLINDSHERTPQKRALGRTAMQMFKSLVDAEILTVRPPGGPGRRVVVNADLQEDFSLNHALSLYLLDTIPLVEASSETYALDLLSLVESILENPDVILMRQLDKIKTDKMAEMKGAGVEYDERIAELEKLDYPKPNRDFIYNTFNAFAAKHPWVGQENIRPKSVAREMVELYLGFNEYIREYGLERSEGLLLRYLSDVYKTLIQTVPDQKKTAELDEIIVFLGAIVRGTDASLLDEWERMRNPEAVFEQKDALETPELPDITRDRKTFTVLVRNLVFQIVRALSRGDYNTAASLVEPGSETWTGTRLEQALAPFWADHARILTDPASRAPSNTQIEETENGTWKVTQILSDPEGDNDWALAFTVSLAASRDVGRAVLALDRIGT